jgi:hypothetical protein
MKHWGALTFLHLIAEVGAWAFFRAFVLESANRKQSEGAET